MPARPMTPKNVKADNVEDPKQKQTLTMPRTSTTQRLARPITKKAKVNHTEDP